MDKEALDRSLARRLLDHIEAGTTDLADEVMELGTDLYTSADHHEVELDVLFHRQPLVLCLSGALPTPGSYRTVDLMGTPVLLSRDRDGRVHAMLNACRHRGVRVMDGVGETRRFTCPFHAWTYDLDGTLVGLPTAEAFDGMCREEKGLVELPVAEGYGLVVGCLRPGPDDRHRRVPRPRPRRRAGRARLRRLDALRRDPRASRRGELEGHARHVPGELPLPVPAQDDAQRVRLRRGAHLRRVRAAPAQLLRAALDRHAARRARRGVGRRLGAHQPPVLAVPEHLHDVRQPPHRAVADRARRRSTGPR